jgi:putative membrane protein
MLLTSLPVQRLLSVQILVFVVLMLLLALPRIRANLLPRKARRTIAYQAAMGQFVRRGLADPRSGPAILIFVSLAERYARIIANDHVAAHVSDAEWRGVLQGLLDELRNGRIADGFVLAIDKSRVLLKTAFPSPPPAAPQRFADRLHVL